MISTARKHLMDGLPSGQEEHKGHNEQPFALNSGTKTKSSNTNMAKFLKSQFPANSISSQAQIYNLVKQHNSGTSVTLPKFSMQS
jgi:hypothetical protein